MKLLTLKVSLLSFFLSALAQATLPQIYYSREDYGTPDYASCMSLLYLSSTAGPGIHNIDGLEHGFYLPYFGQASQFTAV